jgi:hypothetical protein
MRYLLIAFAAAFLMVPLASSSPLIGCDADDEVCLLTFCEPRCDDACSDDSAEEGEEESEDCFYGCRAECLAEFSRQVEVAEEACSDRCVAKCDGDPNAREDCFDVCAADWCSAAEIFRPDIVPTRHVVNTTGRPVRHATRAPIPPQCKYAADTWWDDTRGGNMNKVGDGQIDALLRIIAELRTRLDHVEGWAIGRGYDVPAYDCGE